MIPCRILSIDPGRNTGWCVFDGGIYMGSGVARSGATQRARVARDVSQQIEETCYTFDLFQGGKTQLVIEMAQMFNTATSYASVKRGDLLNLIYLTGVICGRVQSQLASDPELVTPMQWKGQLPKDVVILRLQTHIELERTGQFLHWTAWKNSRTSPLIRDHEADAIGLGLWRMGLFGKARK